ncbi:hypothetical protein ABN028_34030 [Actinopolymorpha sp. B17G11]|uniref:hypothetical protein n=1 Tax=Actinopolymorpha sp. B17G11 TaxID=3160861 RepID=UPI0032E4D3E3
MSGLPDDCLAAVEVLNQMTNVVVPPRERRYAGSPRVYVTAWIQLETDDDTDPEGSVA